VLSYTNHALDQMVVDIQAAGIPADSIVRLGGNFNSNTRALSMSAQPKNYRMSGQTSHMINDQKQKAESYHDSLGRKLAKFANLRVKEEDLLDYLEFSDDSEYFDAFTLPANEDNMRFVGKNNKQVERSYLIKQWLEGKDLGIFENSALRDPKVWDTKNDARKSLRTKWERAIVEEQVSEISTLTAKYNDCCDRVQQLFHMKDAHVICNKRIVACTTTAAAKYTEHIQKAAPGIILVEEAGEILESHILTAMTPATKQLILIGDHKQLRPKVNNYSLTAEKGEGFDLNVSMFERLVRSGVPHTTLNKQHRMRPQISALVRSLTYPELEDAEKTQGRPHLRGFQDSLIFVSHTRPELNVDRIADRQDEGAKTSKENAYEADMVLKCVRYLGQQGYGTDDIVILTPYLGQLFLLTKILSADNDPILNDLDSYELIRAGLLSHAGANVSKRKLRISTIGQYSTWS
jgi:superfamily I DNA and/or RNA helicase